MCLTIIKSDRMLLTNRFCCAVLCHAVVLQSKRERSPAPEGGESEKKKKKVGSGVTVLPAAGRGSGWGMALQQPLSVCV